jgi:hypothetical protein
MLSVFPYSLQISFFFKGCFGAFLPEFLLIAKVEVSSLLLNWLKNVFISPFSEFSVF